MLALKVPQAFFGLPQIAAAAFDLTLDESPGLAGAAGVHFLDDRVQMPDVGIRHLGAALRIGILETHQEESVVGVLEEGPGAQRRDRILLAGNPELGGQVEFIQDDRRHFSARDDRCVQGR